MCPCDFPVRPIMLTSYPNQENPMVGADSRKETRGPFLVYRPWGHTDLVVECSLNHLTPWFYHYHRVPSHSYDGSRPLTPHPNGRSFQNYFTNISKLPYQAYLATFLNKKDICNKHKSKCMYAQVLPSGKTQRHTFCIIIKSSMF